MQDVDVFHGDADNKFKAGSNTVLNAWFKYMNYVISGGGKCDQKKTPT
jgi:hypothetical protein